MSGIAISESQRSLLARMEASRLLDFVPAPVLVLGDDGTAWLNASARALDDWLKVGDPDRSLMQELGPALQQEGEFGGADATQVLNAVLRQAAGSERGYRATLLDASSARSSGGCVAVVLTKVEGTGGDVGADEHSEITRARLEEVQRQLLQADRMSTIGQLAAGVAHEINNPIGYIQSNLETLRDYVSSLFRLIAAHDAALRQIGAVNPVAVREIEKIRHDVDFEFLAGDVPTLLKESQEGVSRVRKIIQDLRDFSRAGHSEEWTAADIHAGIDSTINIVWNELKYKVELIKHYGDLPPVECLPSQLNQVFMNILVNAGQAIDGHGQITISTRTEGESVFIEFSDTGKGIPQEHLARVFEPFFTTKAVGKGTGLGLSISYGIVRKHGGEIDVRSEIGIGTTFLIRLPIHAAAANGDERALQ